MANPKRKTARQQRKARPPRKPKPETHAIVRVAPVPRERPWELNQDQVTLLKNTICKGASDQELSYCLTVARRYKLDPFRQQIWFIRRWDKNADNGEGGKGAYVWVAQVGIYGLLHIAARDHKDYGGMSKPEYGPMITIDVEGHKITGPEWATVKVWKKGQVEPTIGEAYFEEYCPKMWNNTLFWRTMPRRMISKCAKAMGAREACPDLGGLYIPEEMERMNEDFTPGGRQIVDAEGFAPSGQAVTWEARNQSPDRQIAEEVARQKAGATPAPLDELRSKSATQPPAGADRPSAALPVAAPVPASSKGTVEIDWVNGTDKQAILRGDVGDLIIKLKNVFVFPFEDDWYHLLPGDAKSFITICKEEGYAVQQTMTAKSSGGAGHVPSEKPRKGANASEAKNPAPSVVKGTIQAISEKMTKGKAATATQKARPSAPYLSVLIKSKNEAGQSEDRWYSCFDREMFEFLSKGKGKEGEFFTSKSGDFSNIVGLKRIGSQEFESGKLPVIQQKNREAGAKTLF